MVNQIGAVIPWFTKSGTSQLYHKKLEKTIESEEKFLNNEEHTCQELEAALEEIDDLVNSVAEAIIQIAHGDHDEAACILYRAMEDHAREEDTLNTYEQFVCITGRNIDD